MKGTIIDVKSKRWMRWKRRRNRKVGGSGGVGGVVGAGVRPRSMKGEPG